jgi:hypothetical protein
LELSCDLILSHKVIFNEQLTQDVHN